MKWKANAVKQTQKNMNIKKHLCLVVIYIPLLLHAQEEEKGIKWTTGLSWEQVKQKAKQENKYIFMDCYATWCGPCKKMDKETYPDEKVGELVNEKFIAVKVQMDSTKDDAEPIRKWYPTVKEINKNYSIPGYPTYLFFSPDGELVHQDLGYKPVKDFVSLLSDALNPSTQLGTIMEQYKAGNLIPSSLGKVALAEKKIGKKELADSIARKYKAEFLDKLNDADLFTKENIQFATDEFYSLMWNEGTKGRFFDFFFHNTTLVDSLFGKGFAEGRIKNIITKEEMNSKLFNGDTVTTQNPNWESLRKEIASKYGNEYAEQIVSAYQSPFYLYVKNWKKWADLFDDQIKKYPPQKGSKNFGGWGEDSWTLNSNAWTVFQSCNDRIILFRALKWSKLCIKIKKQEGGNYDDYLDTKANLLYKLGRKKKAIKVEDQALHMDAEYAKKKNKQHGDDFLEQSQTLKKMKAGVPTWPIQK
jgi:thioredoxin-related protein